MIPFFQELGRSVLAEWKAANFSLSAFPQIAVAALESRPPAGNVDVAELVREFLLKDEQPFQTSSGFGQPELVVFDDPRFYIQILFWLEGTTDIHQHKFSGAFHVLEGSSIHSRFEFEEPEAISGHLRVGQLRMAETHLLETGSTEPIISGTGYIHSLFHLETPSLTVVVRTHTDPGTGPQWTYLPPHIAVDPFHHDALTIRRKQLLDVLEQTEDIRYPDLVMEMIEQLDFERGFFILQNGMGYLRSLDQWDEALEVFEQKHGRLAEGIGSTLEEIVRRDSLVELRRSVHEPEHRFFLALLLNVPQREGILGMVAQRFSGKPEATILRWAEELMTTSETETWIVDAKCPEEMSDVPPEVFLAALGSFIAEKKGNAKLAGVSMSAKDMDKLREAFAHSSLRALVLAP
jgi:hypothetical protein